MATIISIANHKGGVGKTTTCLNVGQHLAAAGHRVLFVDGDPQTNLTQCFKVPPGGGTLSDLLEGEGRLALGPLVVPVGANQWLLAGSRRLQLVEKLVGGTGGVEYLLRDALSENSGAFDYVLVDTPPSLSGVTLAVLIATDIVIVPAQPEFLGYVGLRELLAACARVKKNANPRLRLGGIFFNRYAPGYRRSLHHQYVTLIREDVQLGPLVLTTTVRENVRLAEAQAQQQATAAYAPGCAGDLDYAALTTEILARL